MAAPQGYTSLGVIGFTDQGTYDNSATYYINDLVHYLGNIYRCKVDETVGIAPAENVNWTVFVGVPTNIAEELIAPVEVSPSTNAYSVGDQLIYNDILYKVTAAIAIGDSLTVGTNIALSYVVVDQLKTINNTLGDTDISGVGNSVTDAISSLNNDLTNLSERSDILGAKNLFPNLLTTSKTVAGVTATPNDDGTISLSGQFTSQESILFTDSWNDTNVEWLTRYEGQSVILSGGITGVAIVIWGNDSNGNRILDLFSGYDGGESSAVTIPSGIANYVSYIYPNSSTLNVNGKTLYPMVRLATDTDSTYQPYAMSNQIMTPHIQSMSNSISNIIAKLGVILIKKNATTSNTETDTYVLTPDDFDDNKAYGFYLLLIQDWTNTPDIGVYLIGYSGNNVANSTLAAIKAHSSLTPTISGSTLTIPFGAYALYALSH